MSIVYLWREAGVTQDANEPVDDGVIRFYGPNSNQATGDSEPALEAAE